jgi:hypothetical protein
MEFQPFPKLHRLFRDIVVTEKIDGTNAQILIDDATLGDHDTSVAIVDGLGIWAGSRSRWLDTSKSGDNFGFAKWVQDNAEELVKLGVGRHFGEWWGQGIQRGYDLDHRKFSLFNTGRWNIAGLCHEGKEEAPECCSVVPILYSGSNDTSAITNVLEYMKATGSTAATGYMNPEGMVVYHTHSGRSYKVTLDNNDVHKWEKP